MHPMIDFLMIQLLDQKVTRITVRFRSPKAAAKRIALEKRAGYKVTSYGFEGNLFVVSFNPA